MLNMAKGLRQLNTPRGRFELPRAKMPTGSPGLRLTGLGYLGFGKE